MTATINQLWLTYHALLAINSTPSSGDYIGELKLVLFGGSGAGQVETEGGTVVVPYWDTMTEGVEKLSQYAQVLAGHIPPPRLPLHCPYCNAIGSLVPANPPGTEWPATHDLMCTECKHTLDYMPDQITAHLRALRAKRDQHE